MASPLPPLWALYRVAGALDSIEPSALEHTSGKELARRTGLSKNLARRCLEHLNREDRVSALSLPPEPRVKALLSAKERSG